MLHLAIAAGLLLGLIVGLGAAATGNEWLLALAKGSAPFGAIFMNAIRMVVIPLMVTVIFTSIARLGDPRKLGRIGGLTIAYYWITLIPAIAIGMATMKVGLQFASEIEMPQAAAAEVPELPEPCRLHRVAGPGKPVCGREPRSDTATDRVHGAGGSRDRDASCRTP